MALTFHPHQSLPIAERHPDHDSKLAALPLDTHIVNGVAIIGQVATADIALARQNLDEAFRALSRKEHDELRTCVAYGLKIGPQDEDVIDDSLIETAANHARNGLVMDRGAADCVTLWEGVSVESGRAFKLSKASGHIALQDGTFPHGLVYTLSGDPR